MRIVPGDPGRVATILPGQGYPCAAPLLYYATMLLTARGWTVRQVSWDDGERTSAQTAVMQARHEIDAVTAPVHLVVAKSLGTFSLPDAVERGLPGVWLTPILNDQSIVAAVSEVSAPTLLIGGTADRFWDSGVARRSRAEVLEIPDGDHSLEVGNAAERALGILHLVVDRMSSFVDNISNTA